MRLPEVNGARRSRYYQTRQGGTADLTPPPSKVPLSAEATRANKRFDLALSNSIELDELQRRVEAAFESSLFRRPMFQDRSQVLHDYVMGALASPKTIVEAYRFLTLRLSGNPGLSREERTKVQEYIENFENTRGYIENFENPRGLTERQPNPIIRW